MMKRIVHTTLIFVCMATNAFAADAGTVLFATGDVTAERESAVTLAKGDAVLDNDTGGHVGAGWEALAVIAIVAIDEGERAVVDGSDEGRVDRDTAVLHIIKAAEQTDNCRFAGTGWPDQGDRLPGAGRQRNILQYWFIAGIAKRYLLKSDCPGNIDQRLGCLCVSHGRVDIQHLKDAFRTS